MTDTSTAPASAGGAKTPAQKPSSAVQIAYLKQQKAALEFQNVVMGEELADLRARVAELEAADKPDKPAKKEPKA